jgi:predicted ATP-binding protein involved in virulence
MRISKIELTNFRLFEHFELRLDDHFTLLVGANGSGKSSVLEGISVGIGSLFLGLGEEPASSLKKEQVRAASKEIGDVVDRQPQYPTKVSCMGILNDQPIQWTRTLNGPKSNTTHNAAVEMTTASRRMNTMLIASTNNLILPVVSFYGTGRLWAKKKAKKGNRIGKVTKRQDGYVDCLDAMSNEKLMYSWFEKMSYQEYQTGVKNSMLTTVQEAMVRSFNGFKGRSSFGKADRCYFDANHGELVIVYHTAEGSIVKSPLSQLSDGFRSMVSLVGDLAYRMAVLNPQLKDRVLDETPGIVLIDEIDLHLHPSWQMHIIEDLRAIFPLVQFVATTHAPHVISSVQKEQVVILDHQQPYPASGPTFGKDANSILQDQMQVPERQESVRELFTAFHQAIDESDLEKAKSALAEMTLILGNDDTDVVGATTTLLLESME